MITFTFMRLSRNQFARGLTESYNKLYLKYVQNDRAASKGKGAVVCVAQCNCRKTPDKTDRGF